MERESEKKGVQHGKGKGHGSVTGTIRPSVAIPMAKTFRLAGANLLTESPIRQNASLKHLKPPKPPEIAGEALKFLTFSDGGFKDGVIHKTSRISLKPGCQAKGKLIKHYLESLNIPRLYLFHRKQHEWNEAP